MRCKFPRLDRLLGRMAEQASWEGGRAGNRARFAVSTFHFSDCTFLTPGGGTIDPVA